MNAEFELLRKKFSEKEQLLTLKQRQINTLSEVTKAINQNLNINALFKFYEYIITQQTKTQILCVFFKRDKWEKICCVGVSDDASLGMDIDEAFKDIRDIKLVGSADSVFKTNGIEVIIPVYYQNEPIAYALLGKIQKSQVEAEGEQFKFIQTITNVIFIEARNKYLIQLKIADRVNQKEMEIASKIQAILIPETINENEYAVASGLYLPHTQIGGDYYDFIQVNDGLIGMAIADISGKGVAAGLLMANFQAHVRTLLNREFSLEQFIDHINFRVSEITNGEKFVTFFIAIYNPETRILTYVNAGHHPPILINGEELSLLDQGCTILGIALPMPNIVVTRIQIDPNALLFMYTDGLVDLRDHAGEYYEFIDLEEFIMKNKDLSPAMLNKKILDKIENDKTNLNFFDDISMLAVRFK
ncbi:MAG: serine/threonine-protein phosphatase [Chitinophagales bacterium]|nr:serine/threonine-protein phosphatase [Chitinophagales bacterium]